MLAWLHIEVLWPWPVRSCVGCLTVCWDDFKGIVFSWINFFHYCTIETDWVKLLSMHCGAFFSLILLSSLLKRGVNYDIQLKKPLNEVQVSQLLIEGAGHRSTEAKSPEINYIFSNWHKVCFSSHFCFSLFQRVHTTSAGCSLLYCCFWLHNIVETYLNNFFHNILLLEHISKHSPECLVWKDINSHTLQSVISASCNVFTFR